MKLKIIIILLSILLTNCGFKPIYGSKNSNFEIVEIKNINENKNSFAIEQAIMSVSNREADRKLKLELKYKQGVSTILKDSRGDPSKNKLSIDVGLKVKNAQDNLLISKTFSEEFNYDIQSDKFSMSQYVDNVSENLNTKISNDIIFLLGTLK